MAVSDGAMSGGEIRPKPRTAGSVRIRYDKVGRRDRTTEFQGPYSAGPLSTHRTWDTMRDEPYEYDDLGHLRRIDQRIRLVTIQKPDLNGTDGPVSEPSKIGAWRPLSVRSLNLRGAVRRAHPWTPTKGPTHGTPV